MPGSLIPGELEKIAEHTGHADDGEWILDHFVASEGAVVGKQVGDAVVMFQIPSIVPRQKPDGRCVFLDENNYCTIHEVSPFGCAYHDVHLDKEAADERSHYAIYAQAAGNEPGQPYGQWHELMTALGLVASPLAERKEGFRREFDNVDAGGH